MIKKFTLVFAFLLSFSGASFASQINTTDNSDGRDDLTEDWGGTRNGGDC